MKIFLLCAFIGAAFVMGGCANQTTPVADSQQARMNARGGIVDRGSVAGMSGAGATPFNSPRTIP
jgi:hypothetical protein